MGNSVLWIRNDFRFHDNTALINAINDIKDNENLIFIYHLDPELIKMETTSYAYFFSSLNSYYESCLKIVQKSVAFSIEISDMIY